MSLNVKTHVELSSDIGYLHVSYKPEMLKYVTIHNYGVGYGAAGFVPVKVEELDALISALAGIRDYIRDNK